jgi:ATP-dependent DNA ligase
MPHRPFEPCIPVRATAVPTGREWAHEIKHDGFRLIVQRKGERVRLLTRRGYDWSDRYPLIAEAARRLRTPSFVLDGEAVWLDARGMADFDKLQSRQHDGEVKFLAFDLLAVDGDDIRRASLHARKTRLAKLLAKSPDAIQLVEHLDGEIGPQMFAHACKLGCGGIVSKRIDRAYQGGRSPDWRKIKNPASPAMKRVEDGMW